MDSTPNTDIFTKHERVWIWGILISAFLVRIFWALASPNLDPIIKSNPLHGDALSYFNLAENMLNGHGYTYTGRFPTAFRMPGYPLFLAIVFRLTDYSLIFVRILQAILGTLTIIPVLRIGNRVGGSMLSLIAGIGFAFHPILIYMVGWVYSETLYIFVLWLSFWFLIKFVDTWQRSIGILAGFGFGIASLIRPEVLVFPLFMSVLLFLFQRFDWITVKRLAIVQGAALLVILPWSIRSSMVFNTWIPLTTSAGLNFHAGNNPQSDGGSAWTFHSGDLPEPTADRMLLKESLHWIRENPQQAFRLIPKKIYKFSSPIEFETQSNPFSELSVIINAIYWSFLVIALFGLWVYQHRMPTMIIGALVLWYLIDAIVFFGGTRVALPVSPGFIILAAGGVTGLVARYRKNRVE